jgi:positive regulator of sigma E activity
MLQLIIGGLVGLTLVYWIISAYSRSVRREKLENEFDAGGIAGLREDFVRTGMAHYEHGLRKRLILLVYVVPVVLIVLIAYVVNHT